MADTKIEWADAVFNPVTGCTKISPGCAHCYAEGIAKRFWGERKFSDVQFHYDRLQIPLKWRTPKRIFVNSMSDLFHKDVSDLAIRMIFETMGRAHWHTFMILTKRPERMKQVISDLVDEGDFFSDHWHVPGEAKEFFPNVWLGVTAENQQTADERIPILLQTPAAVRFVSVEPMIEPVDLFGGAYGPNWLEGWEVRMEHDSRCDGSCSRGLCPVPVQCRTNKLGWVICGCESGPHARPMEYEWAYELLEQCRDTDTPFFYKQGPDDEGKVCKMPKLQGLVWNQIPEVKA